MRDPSNTATLRRGSDIPEPSGQLVPSAGVLFLLPEQLGAGGFPLFPGNYLVTGHTYADQANPRESPRRARPNEVNTSGSVKTTIRAIPDAVTVSTWIACAW